MTRLIIGCGFDKVITFDPHSDVLGALFPSGMLRPIPQAILTTEYFKRLTNWTKNDNVENFKNLVLVAPDAGLLKNHRRR
jgi:phosphoribosylpyrophosphate synthetase